jgi:uncharacterized protein (TIGR04255 family)
VFDLPPTARYQLTRAPLAQALAQVRYPLQARLGTLTGIASVQERLAARYPYLGQQQIQSVEVQFSPESAPAAAVGADVNFTFTSDDGHAIVVTPGSATLSAGAQYQGVEDFAERFRELLTVLEETSKMPRCERLGVRYLTVATTPPGDARAWTRWFRPELVGWAGTELLTADSTVTSAINQVTFSTRPLGELAKFPVDVQAVIRHGLVPGGSALPGIPPVSVDQESYVLDSDVFVVAPQKWNVDTLSEQFSALHGQIDRFFRWTLTATGEEFFGLEELA